MLYEAVEARTSTFIVFGLSGMGDLLQGVRQRNFLWAFQWAYVDLYVEVSTTNT
jgi:hypothetical protein